MNKLPEVILPNGSVKPERIYQVICTVHFKDGHAPVALNLETPHELMVPVVNESGQIVLVDNTKTTWVFRWSEILFIQTEKQNSMELH